MIKKISNILRTLLGEGRDLQNRLMWSFLISFFPVEGSMGAPLVAFL